LSVNVKDVEGEGKEKCSNLVPFLNHGKYPCSFERREVGRVLSLNMRFIIGIYIHTTSHLNQ